MAKVKVLVLAGGQIHDYKSCGAALRATLQADARFDVTYVENDLKVLEGDGLKPYDVLVFYYTVGEITVAQLNGLLGWVASGKGYVGLHSAADSFRGSPDYRAMVGGYFVTHPRYRDYQVCICDTEHPIMKDVVAEQPAEFMVKDEMYVTSWDKRNHILAQALWKDATVPVAWVKDWGQGRVFWLALGHDGPACQQEIVKKLLVRGVVWAATPEEKKA
jgi:hypothetical protein